MHLKRTLLFALVAGALIVAGCSSTGTGTPTVTPTSTTPSTSAITTVPMTTTTPVTTTIPTPTPISDKAFMELIKEDAIEVTACGKTIQNIQMSIKNLKDRSISFTIPIGTFLDSGGASYQSMIITDDLEVDLESHESSTVWVSAACADIDLDIPSSSDTYASIRASPNTKLVAILRSLDEAGASYDTKQAAVWIMTDDADWYDLGTLVSGGGQVRQIDEDEAAEAMQAIDQNRVDITSKAIWTDKSKILAGLSDSTLKAWLETKY